MKENKHLIKMKDPFEEEKEETKYVNVRMPADLVEQIKKQAVSKDMTISSVVRQILKKYFSGKK